MKERAVVPQFNQLGFPLHFTLVLFLVAFLCFVSGTRGYAASVKPERIICKYVMLLEGEKIGETVVSRRPSSDSEPDSLRTETMMTLQAKGFWGTWKLDARSMVEHDNSGVIDFDHKITEDKNRWHLFGKQYKQALWCSARKVQTEKEMKDDEAIDLAKYIIAQAVPYAGETLMVLDLLGGDNDEQGDVSVPLDRFDTTLSELPAYLIRLPEKKKTRFRILDTSELEISSVSVIQKGSEQFALAGRTFACRVFHVKAKKSQSTYWIAEDSLGAFVAREQGEDSDGEYEIILQEIEFKEN